MRAIVTGSTGQDARFLIPALVQSNFEVLGFTHTDPVRHTSSQKNDLKGAEIFFLKDKSRMNGIIKDFRPDHIYNLAGISSVVKSFGNSEEYFSANFFYLDQILETISQSSRKESVKIYQSLSSEIFGDTIETPQNEITPRNPISPYAISKSASYDLCNQYRLKDGLNISCGILYNHESEKRSSDFVSKKIASEVAKISLGLTDKVELGNLDSVRDWGYAGEYVSAMIKMLEQDVGEDFVIASGKINSVGDMLQYALDAAGISCRARDVAVTRDNLMRKSDHKLLVGDPTKAKLILNWEANLELKDIMKIMVESEIELLNNEIQA